MLYLVNGIKTLIKSRLCEFCINVSIRNKLIDKAINLYEIYGLRIFKIKFNIQTFRNVNN